jgi:hypothetical protein
LPNRPEGAQICVLQSILRLGLIVQRCAREPIQAAVVAPHQHFESAAVAAGNPADDRCLIH